MILFLTVSSWQARATQFAKTPEEDAMQSFFDHLARKVASVQASHSLLGASRRGLVRYGIATATGLVGIALSPRHGTDAQGVDAELEAASSKRPGRLSRREGIASWRATKRPTGYTVKFKHNNRSLSGTLTVTYGGSYDSTTWELTRDRTRLQMAMNSARRTVSATDEQGRQLAATFNLRRGEWRMSTQSKQMLRANRRDFDIGSAIASDLAPRTKVRGTLDRSRPGGRAFASQQEQCQSQAMWGISWDFITRDRWTACQVARDALNEWCRESGTCRNCGQNDPCVTGGCCWYYPGRSEMGVDGQDCRVYCFFGDYNCTAEIQGAPCA